MRFLSLLLVLGLVSAYGCGSSAPSTDVTPPGQEQIKPTLESVVETGTIDSGLMVVREELEKMQATDSAKADELLKDLDELETLSGDAAKTKATEMLGKL
jgi:hypothetical protein